MRRLAWIRGGCISTLLCAVVAAQRSSPFPEGQATISHLLLHYVSASEDGWLPVYAGLTKALPTDVRVTVAVAGAAEREKLVALVRQSRLRSPEILEVDQPITPWARDRLLALDAMSPTSLITPRLAGIPEGYAGDSTVAHGLAERLLQISAEVQLDFEGGDIVCSAARAFVGHNTIMANTARSDEATIARRFARLMQTPVVTVGRGGSPHNHLDMYLTSFDANTVLLGCPMRGLRCLRESPDTLPDFDDWNEEVQRALAPTYEEIRANLERRGVRVVRLPILHGANGGVLTFNNCLVERRDGVRRVYMPSYGVPALDEDAAAVVRKLGAQVFPIDVAEIAADGGTVRCLTNVISWRPSAVGRAGS